MTDQSTTIQVKFSLITLLFSVAMIVGCGEYRNPCHYHYEVGETITLTVSDSGITEAFNVNINVEGCLFPATIIVKPKYLLERGDVVVVKITKRKSESLYNGVIIYVNREL